MSKKLDNDFADRLRKAAKHAGVAYKQTAIAHFLGPGLNKQTVDTWMKGSPPRADTLFAAADRFGVDPRWFATGEGNMLARPLPAWLSKVDPDRRIGTQDRRTAISDRRSNGSAESKEERT